MIMTGNGRFMSAPDTSSVVAVALAAVRRRIQEPDKPPSPQALGRDCGVLADAVDAVVAIHYPSKLTVGGYICGKCLDPYPCTTVRALEQHLRTVNT
jgi:hypothetical protein